MLQLDCGHQCCKTCHQGPCTNVSGCTERVRLACTCRRRKKDYPCNEVCVNNLKVQCDEICRQNKKRKQKVIIEVVKTHTLPHAQLIMITIWYCYVYSFIPTHTSYIANVTIKKQQYEIVMDIMEKSLA